MTDLLLQFGISNLGISGAIAVAAWAVHATGKRPLISHLLWLLVLAKLVTPPILTVPVVAVPGQNTTAIAAADWNDRGATAIRGTETTSTAAFGSLEDVKLGLVLLWLLGSACVLAWSLVRIYRFNRLLGMASGVAPPEVQRVASEIAQRLGLKSMPAIHTTSAQLSPMVWWVGGQVRVVIPGALIEELESEEIRSILAHELAHVRRRDHLVRWLEWLASVCFWWNPVAWWARRNPRINEEICCDALVLSTLEPKPKAYAHALVTVAEFLASPAIRPPVVASEISGARFLERRLGIIVSRDRIRKTPRWLQVTILLVAVGLLPLGCAYVEASAPEDMQSSDTPERAEGGMQPEDVKRRLTEMRRAMGEEYQRAEVELRDAVTEGRVKPEDGRRRMSEMREAVGGSRRTFTVEEYRRAEADMRKAVAEGRLKPEDVERRLIGMRKAMAN